MIWRSKNYDQKLSHIISRRLPDTEAVLWRCSVKKVILKISQNSQKAPMSEACNFIKKETLAQVFSCEFCEILKNTSSGYFCRYKKWYALILAKVCRMSAILLKMYFITDALLIILWIFPNSCWTGSAYLNYVLFIVIFTKFFHF